MPALRSAGVSDRGLVRTENQDRWLADSDRGLFVVADGIGGGPQGGLAAEIVVQTLPVLFKTRLRAADDAHPDADLRLVREALAELSELLRRQISSHPELEGMGSTAVLLTVRGNRAVVGHLGDSRAYLWRSGGLTRLTSDHSLLQLLLEAGEIDPDEAGSHPARAQLTQYVGMNGEPLPVAAALGLKPGDRLLLCSDGLTGAIGETELCRILGEPDSPESAARRLVDAAMQAGAIDNITAVVVTTEGAP